MNFKKNWKRFCNVSRNHDGFTLVELIVAIAIMAILAGVAVPAYSGYIEKGKIAADEALLHDVNNAFAAAVMAKQEDFYAIPNGGATLNTNCAVGYSNAEVVAEYNNVYFTNEGAKFQTYTAFSFVKGKGFTGMNASMVSEAFKTVLEKLQHEDNADNLETLVESVFGEMGADVLMGKVDFTSDLAAALVATDPDGDFAQLILNCGQAMSGFLGMDASSPEYGALMQNIMSEKMEQLQATNPEFADLSVEDFADLYDRVTNPDNPNGASDEEQALFNAAQNAIAANNAILSAAQNSAAVSGTIINTLKGNPVGNLLTSVDNGIANGNTGESMAQVAMAYGLYTAYAERNNLTVPSDPGEVLSQLNSGNFQSYLSTQDAQDDLDAFQSSMNMIVSSATGNKDAVSDILVNGFADPQLVAVLQQAMAGASSK